MSRLDRQIAAVRTKLTLDRFLSAAASALLAAAGVAFVYVLLRTFAAWRLPREAWCGVASAALAAVWGLVVALRRRPGVLDAATAIDDRLGLNEKFSTALHARTQTDPFSRAAVLDAEKAAESTLLRGQFKLHWPRAAGPAFVVMLIGAAVLWLVPPRNLFASGPSAAQFGKAVTPQAKSQAKAVVEKSLAALNSAPKAAADQNAVKLAKSELQELLKKPDFDPAAAQRKALSALQDLQRASEQVQKTQTFADAKRNEQLLSKLKPEDGETGPVAEAQKELAKGNLDAAVEKLNRTVEHFDQMTDSQKQQAAQQMQQLAAKLQQQAAANPAQQQQQQKQLQQMGMSQQQAQQAQQLMQQAAQGNQQAQQQLQQMAKQAMQQANKGQGPSQQQVQQAQQMLQQMQAQANGTQQAQQLQQAAAAMAGAMRQAAGQNPQQASQQQQGQGKQGQPSNQGQQPGQGQQQSQQQMQQAMQSMQQQLQQMQATAQDANQVAAAQQNAAQAASQAQNAMNGQGQSPGQTPGQNQNGGKVAQGNPGGSRAGKGHTASSAITSPDVPFTTERQTAASDPADNGRILASSLVKSDAPKGESHAQLQKAARAAEQDAADEVDSERVGREGQKVVRDYFGSMGN